MAIDAAADGSFKSDIYVVGKVKELRILVEIEDDEGNTVSSFESAVEQGSNYTRVHGKVDTPLLWNPEFPHLYTARFSLLDKSGTLWSTGYNRYGQTGSTENIGTDDPIVSWGSVNTR